MTVAAATDLAERAQRRLVPVKIQHAAKRE
jgi:hypothetical protein